MQVYYTIQCRPFTSNERGSSGMKKVAKSFGRTKLRAHFARCYYLKEQKVMPGFLGLLSLLEWNVVSCYIQHCCLSGLRPLKWILVSVLQWGHSVRRSANSVCEMGGGGGWEGGQK